MNRCLSREKISVIVPCYNAERTLSRCVDSILAQSLDEADLELILVNDGSEDQTADRILDYEKRYPDTILFINCEENGKQGRARNIGLEYSGGEYIAFVDADDSVAATMLERLYRGAREHGADVSECTMLELPEGKEPPEAAEGSGDSFFLQIASTDERRELLLREGWAAGPVRRLYRKEFLDRNRIRFLEGTYFEDLYFTYLVLAGCQSWYQIPDPLYYYYQNPDSVMRSSRQKEYYMDLHSVFSVTIEELKCRGAFEELKTELEFIYFRKVFFQLASFTLRYFQDPPLDNIRLMKRYISENFPGMRENVWMKQEHKEAFDLLWSAG